MFSFKNKFGDGPGISWALAMKGHSEPSEMAKDSKQKIVHLSVGFFAAFLWLYIIQHHCHAGRGAEFVAAGKHAQVGAIPALPGSAYGSPGVATQPIAGINQMPVVPISQPVAMAPHSGFPFAQAQVPAPAIYTQPQQLVVPAGAMMAPLQPVALTPGTQVPHLYSVPQGGAGYMSPVLPRQRVYAVR